MGFFRNALHYEEHVEVEKRLDPLTAEYNDLVDGYEKFAQMPPEVLRRVIAIGPQLQQAQLDGAVLCDKLRDHRAAYTLRAAAQETAEAVEASRQLLAMLPPPPPPPPMLAPQPYPTQGYPTQGYVQQQQHYAPQPYPTQGCPTQGHPVPPPAAPATPPPAAAPSHDDDWG